MTSKSISWLKTLLEAWRIANSSNIWAHCASVGFFGFLSIFPVMAVFVLLYGLAFSPAEMYEQISFLRAFIPDTVYEVLNSRLSELVSNTASALTFSLIVSSLLALYAGAKGIKSLIILINLAFHITQERGLIQSTIRAVGLTFAAIVVLIIAISSIAVIPLIAAYFPFPQVAKTIALWSRWPILAGIIFSSFLGLYRLAPNRDAIALKQLMPGAALATILWIILSALFSIYVQNFNNYSAEFGALSAAVVIMLWLYYSAFIVAFGAIFNSEAIENAKPCAIRVY
ncbi:YihY/virulence factor BrkB family protein [Psychrobacter aquaticus]|uniref:Inner membrane protein YihY, formerly thought to be RNase BN n=1 Tax=Psychrobacter aquaticus CMS 56 TaxID=1354303 RepID=U4T8N4_9GAMM|nr:YihY/virulence factor BrkB family protein [Psychrobacter aquaticus]ERL54843.1 Inner membrane protein YihY, formerly thought to be RNase BN [Psychrobacter aquaticus CMS 56]